MEWGHGGCPRIEMKLLFLEGIPSSVSRTWEETLRFFCNNLARFLWLLLPFSCRDGRMTSGLSLWLSVARAKRRWILKLVLESAWIISIRHKRHVSSERHSKAWVRWFSLSSSFSRIFVLLFYLVSWKKPSTIDKKRTMNNLTGKKKMSCYLLTVFCFTFQTSCRFRPPGYFSRKCCEWKENGDDHFLDEYD